MIDLLEWQVTFILHSERDVLKFRRDRDRATTRDNMQLANSSHTDDLIMCYIKVCPSVTTT